MSKRIQITEPEERYEADRQIGLQAFFSNFGKLQHPNCYLCSEARGDRFIKVDSFAVDYNPNSNRVSITCKCHGDTFEMQQDLEDLLILKQIDTRMVFKPGQGQRVDSRILAIIPRRHALDRTYAY